MGVREFENKDRTRAWVDHFSHFTASQLRSWKILTLRHPQAGVVPSGDLPSFLLLGCMQHALLASDSRCPSCPCLCVAGFLPGKESRATRATQHACMHIAGKWSDFSVQFVARGEYDSIFKKLISRLLFFLSSPRMFHHPLCLELACISECTQWVCTPSQLPQGATQTALTPRT